MPHSQTLRVNLTFAERLRIFSSVFWDSWKSLQAVRRLPRENGRLDSRTTAPITHQWGEGILHKLGFEIIVSGAPLSQEPCLFVSNHMSYLDIPLWMALAPAAFVAKKSVSRWPIFGPGATAIGTAFVDRGSATSRMATGQAIAGSIKECGRSIVLFPEGTSSLEGGEWRSGSFTIAKRHGFKIQAASLCWEPARTCAYIDHDTFVTHLWHLTGVPHPLRVYVEFFDPIEVGDPGLDAKATQDRVLASLRSRLKGPPERAGVEG